MNSNALVINDTLFRGKPRLIVWSHNDQVWVIDDLSKQRIELGLDDIKRINAYLAEIGWVVTAPPKAKDPVDDEELIEQGAEFAASMRETVLAALEVYRDHLRKQVAASHITTAEYQRRVDALAETGIFFERQARHDQDG